MQAANSNDPKWKDTMEEEIKAYIGLKTVHEHCRSA